MKLRRYEKLALWLLFTFCFCGGCLRHSEAKVDASLSRKLDVSEPVAVPKSYRFRGWSFFKPIVPTAGGPLSPPSVAPLPDAPPDLPTFYVEGEIDYGEGQKTAHSGEAISVKAEGTNDSRPPGILDLIIAHWPWLLALVPVALLLFRKHPKLARLLRLAPPPFSWLAPKE